MNLPYISWNYLKGKPLNTFLNVLLLGLGIAIIIVLLLVSRQLEDNLGKNSKGIDLVVGAKGSPLQLILSSIFHIDFPTGNIPLDEAEKLLNHRLVKTAIPLALGDSYSGYRIVGTSREYPDLYNAELAEGAYWKEHYEATIGASVALKSGLNVGDSFYSSHGISGAGHSHEEEAFQVVGILAQTGTALDNLIFTNIETVWLSHEEAFVVEEDTANTAEVDTPAQRPAFGVRPGGASPAGKARTLVLGNKDRDPSIPLQGKEVTSLLIQYRSPMGAVQLPRFVNSQSSLQAASPAFETARLFTIIGVGVDVLQGFAYLIIIISALSIFIALYNALKERKYDLAIMRSLGASRGKLFVHVLLEGIIITSLGALAGLLMGHGLVELIGRMFEQTGQLGVTGKNFLSEELIILLGSLAVGVVAAIIPAIQSYRTDISKVLAQG
jgi:putative ABC transport system permease protein